MSSKEKHSLPTNSQSCTKKSTIPKWFLTAETTVATWAYKGKQYGEKINPSGGESPTGLPSQKATWCHTGLGPETISRFKKMIISV